MNKKKKCSISKCGYPGLFLVNVDSGSQRLLCKEHYDEHQRQYQLFKKAGFQKASAIKDSN